MCCSWSGAAILWPLQWALTEKQMLHVVFTRWRWSVHFSSSIQSTLVCSLYVAFWICQLGKDKEGIGDEDTKLTPRKARSPTTHSHSISATSTHTRPFYQEHSLLTMNNRFFTKIISQFCSRQLYRGGHRFGRFRYVYFHFSKKPSLLLSIIFSSSCFSWYFIFTPYKE